MSTCAAKNFKANINNRQLTIGSIGRIDLLDNFDIIMNHPPKPTSIKNWMGPYQRTPKEIAIELLDAQVERDPFSGSCWRFLGLPFRLFRGHSGTLDVVFVSDFVFLNHLNPSTQHVFWGRKGRWAASKFRMWLVAKGKGWKHYLYDSFITLCLLNNTEIPHLSEKKTPFHAGFVDDAFWVGCFE